MKEKTYTLDDIIRAFEKWETNARINPTGFLNREEARSIDVKDTAKHSAEVLVYFMNKDKE